MNRTNNPDIRHQPRNRPGRIRAPRKPKTKNLIARLIIQYNEIIRLDDVLRQSRTEPTLPLALSGRQVSRSNSAVVVDDLVEFLAIFFTNAGDVSAEFGHVGGDVFSEGDAGLPGAIAADDDAAVPGFFVGGGDSAHSDCFLELKALRLAL